jgi:hypothetical protein
MPQNITGIEYLNIKINVNIYKKYSFTNYWQLPDYVKKYFFNGYFRWFRF